MRSTRLSYGAENKCLVTSKGNSLVFKVCGFCLSIKPHFKLLDITKSYINLFYYVMKKETVCNAMGECVICITAKNGKMCVDIEKMIF